MSIQNQRDTTHDPQYGNQFNDPLAECVSMTFRHSSNSGAQETRTDRGFRSIRNDNIFVFEIFHKLSAEN